MSKGRGQGSQEPSEKTEFSGTWPGVCSENYLCRVPAGGRSGGWKGLSND